MEGKRHKVTFQTKDYGQLRKSESKRNSLFPEKSLLQLVIQTPSQP